MAGRYRPRQVFKFWLFKDKPEEYRLVEFIEYCKAKRSFARVIRDGIRLMWSLGEGDTSVLFELFPGLHAQLQPIQPAPTPPDTGHLERQIADLKRLILEQGAISAPPKDYPQMKSGGTLGIGKKMALPVFDDEDEGATLILSKSSTGNNGSNLLGGILAL
jgi:hypothetical protein